MYVQLSSHCCAKSLLLNLKALVSGSLWSKTHEVLISTNFNFEHTCHLLLLISFFLMNMLLQRGPYHDVGLIAFRTCSCDRLMQVLWNHLVQLSHPICGQMKATAVWNFLFDMFLCITQESHIQINSWQHFVIFSECPNCACKLAMSWPHIFFTNSL